MSESTRTTADGGTSDALNVEDLFATDDTDISIDDEESDDRPAAPGSETVTPDAEDTTADELFARLRAEQDDADQAHGVDDVADESPDEIMARADEDEVHVDQIDESIRADEGALDDLLLTERREADGFLWVETEDEDAAGDDVGSLFAPDDTDEGGDDATTSDEDATEPEAADASGDADADGFSLANDSGGSFDARAATFDSGDDFAADAATFAEDDGDEAESATERVPDSTAEDSASAPDGTDADADRADESHGATPAAGATDRNDDDEGDDEDGLASRIRSILTG